MIEIIKNHIKKYPLAQTRDIVKLIYQNEFGCGHFITDSEKSLTLIKEEYENSIPTDTVFEDIGNGYVRMYLSSLNDESFDPQIINKLFIMSANEKSGSTDSLKAKLALIEEDDFLKSYIKSGCPMLSHSDAYKNAYHPSYRVMKKDFAELYFIILAIKKASLTKNITVAFDGRSAAGKTTAAGIISEVLNCRVIHADDFFLPFDMRSRERLNEIGGNIHYERLKSEVIDKLNEKSLSFGKFDCSKGKITSVITEEIKPITIIEGAYSSHPYFGNVYDIKVFFDISPEEQKRRIEKRNPLMLEKFTSIWIPMENKYISEFEIDKKSDFIKNDCLK